MFPPRRTVILRTDRRRRFRKRHELAPTRAVVRAVIWADIPQMAAEPMTTFARSRFSGKRGGPGSLRMAPALPPQAKPAQSGRVPPPSCPLRGACIFPDFWRPPHRPVPALPSTFWEICNRHRNSGTAEHGRGVNPKSDERNPERSRRREGRTVARVRCRAKYTVGRGSARAAPA